MNLVLLKHWVLVLSSDFGYCNTFFVKIQLMDVIINNKKIGVSLNNDCKSEKSKDLFEHFEPDMFRTS